MSMLIFFAALCNAVANSPSLKLSVSASIDDIEIVSANSKRTNIGDMKKLTNLSIP